MYSYQSWNNHNESIYRAGPEVSMCQPEPKPMYRSQYSSKVREDSQKGKTGIGYSSMGVPFVQLSPPECYLRKHSKRPISKIPPRKAADSPSKEVITCQSQETVVSPQLSQEGPQKEDFQINESLQGQLSTAEVPARLPAQKSVSRICESAGKRAPLPSKGPVVIPRGSKDFVRENAVSVLRMPPKIPEARLVDTPTGHSYNWCKSGLARKFVCKEDYGMIPGYLIDRRNELIANDRQALLEMERKQMSELGKCRHLEESARNDLICGLKEAWAKTFLEFQRLPLAIDTPAKVTRKAELENTLKELEKDIQLFLRHNHVFIADTDHSFYL